MSRSLYNSSSSDPERRRVNTPSAASASARSRRESRLQSFSGSDSWEDIDRDDVVSHRSRQPSRQPSAAHYTTEAPRPPSAAPSRSRSHRGPDLEPEDFPPRRRHDSASSHPRADSRRPPSDDSFADTVASRDDPHGRHAMPPRAYSSTYRHVRPVGHGGYAATAVNARAGPAYSDQYEDSLVHMPGDDDYDPYAAMDNAIAGVHPNHYAPQYAPYTPGRRSPASVYYPNAYPPPMPPPPRPPGPPRPKSYIDPVARYPADSFGQGFNAYGGTNYATAGWPYAADRRSAYMPNDDYYERQMDHRRQDEIDILKAQLQKHEEARIAVEREKIARDEAEIAAMKAIRAREEEDKRRRDELFAAEEKAKEAAEKKAEEAAKKAKEDSDKKLKEVEAAREKAEKKQKELEEEAAKNKPPADHTLAPIVFKDAVGRKFQFPFHLCKTWKGMESLIRQAFMPVEIVVDRVLAGEYDLTGPDGQIILPAVWDNMVKPAWEVTMAMWPEQESKYPDPLPGMMGGMRIGDPRYKKGHKPSKPKPKKLVSPLIGGPPFGGMGGIPPPPPPPLGAYGMPPGVIQDPYGGGFPPMDYDGPVQTRKPSSSSSSKVKASKNNRLSWFGSSKPAKKK